MPACHGGHSARTADGEACAATAHPSGDADTQRQRNDDSGTGRGQGRGQRPGSCHRNDWGAAAGYPQGEGNRRPHRPWRDAGQTPVTPQRRACIEIKLQKTRGLR